MHDQKPISFWPPHPNKPKLTQVILRNAGALLSQAAWFPVPFKIKIQGIRQGSQSKTFDADTGKVKSKIRMLWSLSLGHHWIQITGRSGVIHLLDGMLMVVQLFQPSGTEIPISIPCPARCMVPTPIHILINLCCGAEENSRFISPGRQRKRKHLFSLIVKVLGWEGEVLHLILTLFLVFFSYSFHAQQEQKPKFSLYQAHALGWKKIHISTFFSR